MTRAKRARETPEYAAMVRRVIAAHGRRVGAEGDEPDLAALIALTDVVDQAIQEAVDGMRERGCSWSFVARGTGTSRQGAEQRYGTGRTTSGARLRAAGSA